jgi:ABC-2 type transport system permease protein
VVGLTLFELTRPPSAVNAAAFLLSVPLAVTISFALRFLVACTAFWLLDASGVKVLSGAVAIFFSGMMLPLVLFPGWLGTLAEALPWAGFMQVPADLWIGRHQGTEVLGALGFQVLWIVVLLAGCHLVLHAATRKVVVQGG